MSGYSLEKEEVEREVHVRKVLRLYDTYKQALEDIEVLKRHVEKRYNLKLHKFKPTLAGMDKYNYLLGLEKQYTPQFIGLKKNKRDMELMSRVFNRVFSRDEYGEDQEVIPLRERFTGLDADPDMYDKSLDHILCTMEWASKLVDTK